MLNVPPPARALNVDPSLALANVVDDATFSARASAVCIGKPRAKPFDKAWLNACWVEVGAVETAPADSAGADRDFAARVAGSGFGNLASSATMASARVCACSGGTPLAMTFAMVCACAPAASCAGTPTSPDLATAVSPAWVIGPAEGTCTGVVLLIAGSGGAGRAAVAAIGVDLGGVCDAGVVGLAAAPGLGLLAARVLEGLGDACRWLGRFCVKRLCVAASCVVPVTVAVELVDAVLVDAEPVDAEFEVVLSVALTLSVRLVLACSVDDVAACEVGVLVVSDTELCCDTPAWAEPAVSAATSVAGVVTTEKDSPPDRPTVVVSVASVGIGGRKTDCSGTGVGTGAGAGVGAGVISRAPAW